MFRSLFTQFTRPGSGCPGRGARRAMARAASLAAITVLALGTLSGPAEAQQTRFTDLPAYASMATVHYWSGGDADVNTQPGRFTDVTVQTGWPDIDPGGLSGYIAVLYEVKEGAPDYTVLRKVDIVRFYAPKGWRIVSVLPNRFPVNWSHRYFGKDHTAHDESAAVEGTYFRNLFTQIDGPGPDDQGNAWMSAIIAIPVELVSN
jgi:hypothetical protein